MTISMNFAISADGRIAGIRRPEGRWTSEADLKRLLALREKADALLVGRGTLEADDMSLTVPGAPPSRQPLRCVVSRSGQFDPGHKLFRTPGGPVHLLVTGPDDPTGEIAEAATVHRGMLAGFLETLRSEFGVRRLHCEGGGQLARELLALDVVDTLHLTWAAHALFGGREAPGITGLPGDFLPASRQFRLVEFDPREDSGECFLSYTLREKGEFMESA
jgi:riboflavin-specific deaminase-like protein